MTVHILLNCLASRSGGANAYLRNIGAPLQAALATRGAGLTVLARTDQADLLAGIPAGQRLLIDARALAGPRRLLWESRHLDRVARKAGATVTFTPYQAGTLAGSTANVSMLRNMEPFASGRYRYGTGQRLRNLLLRRMSRSFLRGSDAVIAVSDFALAHARDELGIAPARLTRIYHGRDVSLAEGDVTEDLAVLANLGVTPPYLFSCGSVLPYRRYEDVIAAYGKFAAGNDAAPGLVLAGSGTDARYRTMLLDQIARSPARNRIRFLGQVPYFAMGALYRRSALFVTSTEVEACPNIAIEAMTAGCAILAADSPVMMEMLGDAAAYYPVRDTRALADLLARHVAAGDVSRAQRERARARAVRFSWDVCAASTAELLVRTASGRGRD